MNYCKKIYFFTFYCIFIFTNCQLQALSVSPEEFGEPHYSIVDNNNINMASGLLYYRLNDLSIGSGELSLSHHITINSNSASNLESYLSGYKDKFRGGIRRTIHTSESSRRFEVIQVADHEGSYDFIINNNGEFEGVSGSLNRLTVAQNRRHFILTKKNGTRVYFYSRTEIPNFLAENYSAYASMVKIEEPNGFIIDIYKSGTGIGDRITSVNTNNGLQLKYIYEVHNRPLDVSKRNATSDPQILADSLNWSNQFPDRIIALNNAVESCPIEGNTCNYTGVWPEVKYQWPDGMPRAMYIGESTFKVIDAYGTTTEFIHTAIDKEEGHPYNPAGFGRYFLPKITKVKDNKGFEINYEYKNIWNFVDNYLAPIYSIGFGSELPLKSATKSNVTTGYNFGDVGVNPGSITLHAGGGYKIIDSVKLTANTYLYIGKARLSVPFHVSSWGQETFLDKDFENKIHRIENKLNGVPTDYYYDSKGRLITVDVDGLLQRITYPYSYTFCDNYKICHKVASVSSWHLQGHSSNSIFYQYNPNSGGVSSITYPANSENKIEKYNYIYTQYYARYKNPSGSIVTSTTPIWLISSKHFCKNSNMNGTNCTGNDKVTITYEYGSGSSGNNLFLLGEKFAAQDETTTWTTCYKYDRYGNQIEVSKPKSGITNCNIGREY